MWNRVVGGCCLLLFLLGCAEEKPPIRIGVVLPLSGVFQIYGEQGLKGAQLAVDEINQQGGVLGHPLELVARDNQTKPAESVRLARQLIQVDNVFALFGPVSSAARYSIQEVAEQFKVPQFYGIDYEGGHVGRYLVCYSTVPEHYIDPIVPFLLEHSGSRFYVFGYDYIWPHRMTHRIERQVSDHGGSVVGVEFTAFGVNDYTGVFDRIKASKADNLMLILPGNDGFNFLEQMNKYEFGHKLSVIAFASDENYLSSVSPEALEGVYSALHFFSSWPSADATAFVHNFQQKFGQQSIPTYSSKSHYSLVYTLKAAIEKAGVVDREASIDAMPGITINTGNGLARLREDQHYDLPMLLARFQEGQLKVIKDFGLISPANQKSIEHGP